MLSFKSASAKSMVISSELTPIDFFLLAYLFIIPSGLLLPFPLYLLKLNHDFPDFLLNAQIFQLNKLLELLVPLLVLVQSQLEHSLLPLQAVVQLVPMSLFLQPELLGILAFELNHRHQPMLAYNLSSQVLRLYVFDCEVS